MQMNDLSEMEKHEYQNLNRRFLRERARTARSYMLTGVLGTIAVSWAVTEISTPGVEPGFIISSLAASGLSYYYYSVARNAMDNTVLHRSEMVEFERDHTPRMAPTPSSE